jgi:hypothetical protein
MNVTVDLRCASQGKRLRVVRALPVAKCVSALLRPWLARQPGVNNPGQGIHQWTATAHGPLVMVRNLSGGIS